MLGDNGEKGTALLELAIFTRVLSGTLPELLPTNRTQSDSSTAPRIAGHCRSWAVSAVRDSSQGLRRTYNRPYHVPNSVFSLGLEKTIAVLPTICQPLQAYKKTQALTSEQWLVGPAHLVVVGPMCHQSESCLYKTVQDISAKCE